VTLRVLTFAVNLDLLVDEGTILRFRATSYGFPDKSLWAVLKKEELECDVLF